MQKQKELVARFIGERNVFGDPSKGEPRIVIANVDVITEDGTDADVGDLKIKGPADEGELIYKMVYRFYGRVMNHWKWGDQFVFDSFVSEKPSGQEAVEAYLRQLDGIGPKKATILFSKYGDDAVRELRENPETVGREVGLTLEQCESASQLLKKSQAIEKTSMELYGLLHGRGLPRFKKMVEEMIRDFGARAPAEVRRNPYLLMKYNGVGFTRADKMFLEFGPRAGEAAAKHAARIKRQALCAWNALASAREGDTWFSMGVIKRALAEKISGTKIEIEKAIRAAINVDILAERMDHGDRWFAEYAKDRSEGRVARFIAEAADETANDGTKWPDLESIRGRLTDPNSPKPEHQYEQAKLALRGVVAVLAGSPGTGKTYSTAEIIRLVLAGGYPTAACAPTGKAAVRLTEALNEAGINLRATTIHSLLGVMSFGDGGWSFAHNEYNPLPHAFVFIDEFSMTDIPLAAALLSARARGTHFLFIGDPNQLAPVGHGAPLRDFISSGVLPVGTLTEIKRNSGRIVRTCAEIRDKRRFSAADKPDLERGENLVLISRDTPQKQIETLETLMRQFINAVDKKYDPIWDVQIIVAVNKKSPLGRKPLNEKLQELLNPDGQRVKGNPFRVGDKIICIKNSWFPAVDPDQAEKDGKCYVANGEQGEVLDVSPARSVVRLSAPDRELIVPRSQKTDDDDESGEVGDDDVGAGCNWDLGYAISCHRSQGSQWKVVLIPADEYGGARMVQSRQWLFTGISRAKDLCLVIGKQSVCNDMCWRDALFSRKTFLVERMKAIIATGVDVPVTQDEQDDCETETFMEEVLQGVL